MKVVLKPGISLSRWWAALTPDFVLMCCSSLLIAPVRNRLEIAPGRRRFCVREPATALQLEEKVLDATIRTRVQLTLREQASGRDPVLRRAVPRGPCPTLCIRRRVSVASARRQDRRRDLPWARRAARDPDVDREQILELRRQLGRVGEDAAAEGAVAEGSDETRLGHRLVGKEQRPLHPLRDRPGDEEDVGVPRRGGDVEAEALQVVLGRRGRGQLVLAGVAGASVDVADRERARAFTPRQRRFAADPLQLAEEDEHDQRSTQA